MAASVEVDPDALDGGLEAPTPKDAQRSEELKSSANQAFQAGKFAQVLRLALAGCGVPDATRCAWTKMLVDQTPPQSIMDCWHVSSASRPTPSFRAAALHSPFTYAHPQAMPPFCRPLHFTAKLLRAMRRPSCTQIGHLHTPGAKRMTVFPFVPVSGAVLLHPLGDCAA